MKRQAKFLFRSALVSLALLFVPLNVANALSETAEKIKYETGITVRYEDIPSQKKLTFKSLNDAKIGEEAVSVFEEVLSVYPANIGDFLTLPYINIVKDLTSIDTETDDILSLEGVTQAEFNNSNGSLKINRIYVNYPTSIDPANVYHHELFHAIEFVYPANEKKWIKIAPESSYGVKLSHFANNSKTKKNYLAYRQGFFSTYSYLSSDEDRAEIFSYLVSPPKYTFYEQASLANDPILKQKCEFMLGYIQSVFEDDPDSDRLLNRLQTGYNSLFEQPYFAAHAIATISKDITVYSEPDKQGTAFNLKQGDYIYIVNTLMNPAKSYLALDKDAHLFIVAESQVNVLETIDIKAELASLQTEGLTLYFQTKQANIVGESLLDDKETLTVDNAKLLYGTIQDLKTTLPQHTDVAIDRIVFLKNIKYKKKKQAITKINSTLYIDILHATNQDIVDALTIK